MKDAGGRDRSPCLGSSLLPLPLGERVLSTHPPRVGRDPNQLRRHVRAKSLSVVSDSLRPHGLQPTRLLCPWDSLGKNSGAGCHVLLQGIFSDTRTEPQFPTSPALEPPEKSETSRRKNHILSALCLFLQQTNISFSLHSADLSFLPQTKTQALSGKMKTSISLRQALSSATRSLLCPGKTTEKQAFQDNPVVDVNPFLKLAVTVTCAGSSF